MYFIFRHTMAPVGGGHAQYLPQPLIEVGCGLPLSMLHLPLSWVGRDGVQAVIYSEAQAWQLPWHSTDARIANDYAQALRERTGYRLFVQDLEHLATWLGMDVPKLEALFKASVDAMLTALRQEVRDA